MRTEHPGELLFAIMFALGSVMAIVETIACIQIGRYGLAWLMGSLSLLGIINACLWSWRAFAGGGGETS